MRISALSLVAYKLVTLSVLHNTIRIRQDRPVYDASSQAVKLGCEYRVHACISFRFQQMHTNGALICTDTNLPHVLA